MDIDTFTEQTDELLRRQNDFEEAKLATKHLPGEDLWSSSPGDANEWVAVYRELVDFIETMVGAIDERQRNLPNVAARGLDRDLAIMTLQLKRYKLHLKYWQERRRVLLAAEKSV